MKFDFGDKQIYIDGYLKNNLDLLKEAVSKKWDGLFYVCGYEGDGKTMLSAQALSYLDPSFDINRCCFTPEQFAKAVEEAKPQQAVLFDEAYLTFTNMSFHKEATKQIISLLTMIRKKQLFICIVAPTFFDINKYLVIHRSRFVLRVYADGLERGFFLFYNRTRKHELYIRGKREHNFNVVKANFHGRFTKAFPVDEEAYEKKKDAAITLLQDALKGNPIKTAEQRKTEIKKGMYGLMNWLKRNNWITTECLKAASTGFFGVQYDTLRYSIRYATNPLENGGCKGENGQMVTSKLK